ncbi:unnamed protein product [Durusdinium trenchii]|uniref:Pentatricopeptide repeat-containing protein, chloroplastic n=2 Tax=Durusdinium trenchii TaxID=1381693 RepID=A0ABP0L3M4_9DINO
MRKQQGIWGHVGHLHSSNPDLARWINRPKKPTVVDYANAAWFLEASWISRAFLREPPPSKLTGEDLHLSYMVRKVLGLETRVVGWRRDKHPFSRYRLQMTDKTTLTPPMFSLRSFLLRAEMSRGPAVRHEPIQCLAYVDTPLQARHLLKLRREGVELCSSCSRDLKVALLLSGLQDDIEVQEIEEVGRILCHESFGPCFVPYEVCGEVCQNMGFAKVTSLNMRVGPSGTRPFLAADLLEAAGSVLLALHVRLLVLPAEESWMSRTVLLAAQLYQDDEGDARTPALEIATLPSEGQSCDIADLPKCQRRPDPVLKELQEGSIVTDVLGTVGSDWASKPRLATTTLAKVPWWKAIAVLEGMVTLQMRINEFHCNVVLKASPWRQQGAHLMSMANAQLEQDQVTLTSGIAKGEAPWPVAVRRLHEMNNHHIRCDVTGFSALLTACDKQRWTKAFEFLHHMALQKLLPDVVTITAGIVAAGSLMSWPLSLKLCQMRPKEVLLNAFVLTSVLKACDPPGQWGLALLHLQHAFAQRAPPTSACNAAAGLLSRVGLWHWVLTVALTRPDNLSWPIAVNACSAANLWQTALQLAFQSHNHMAASTACERVRKWQLALALLGKRPIKGSSPEALASQAWALSKDPAAARPSKAGLAQVNQQARELAILATQKLDHFEARELASLLWSLVSIAYVDRALLDGASTRLLEDRLHQLSVRELASLAMALASSSFDHSTGELCLVAFQALQREIAARAGQISLPADSMMLQDLADRLLDILWACKFAGYLSTNMLSACRRLLDKIACALGQLQGQQLQWATLAASHQEGCDENPGNPQIVVDFGDRSVVHKPPSFWQVDDGKDEPEDDVTRNASSRMKFTKIPGDQVQSRNCHLQEGFGAAERITPAGQDVNLIFAKQMQMKQIQSNLFTYSCAAVGCAIWRDSVQLCNYVKMSIARAWRQCAEQSGTVCFLELGASDAQPW